MKQRRDILALVKQQMKLEPGYGIHSDNHHMWNRFRGFKPGA